jgi:hypothetical protein
MKDLKVGDKILTAANHYETVYAFGHYQPNKQAEFLKIETDDLNMDALEVTAEHLLYRKGNAFPVNAGSIKVGDQLLSLDSVSTKTLPTVTKISSVIRTGIYAPLTTSGSFLANGLRVSSYAALQPKCSNDDTSEYVQFQDGTKFMPQQWGVHLVLAPFRWYCQNVEVCESYNANGMPQYVSNGIDFLRWMDEQSMLFQVLLFVPALLVFFIAFIVEKIMVDNASPVMIYLSCLVIGAALVQKWVPFGEVKLI